MRASLFYVRAQTCFCICSGFVCAWEDDEWKKADGLVGGFGWVDASLGGWVGR